MNNIQDDVKNRLDEDTMAAMDTIGASLYGLSPQFIRDHGKMIDSVRKTLSQKIESANRQGKVGSDQSNVGEYVTIMTKLNTVREKRDMLDSIKNGSYYTNPSGSYEIGDDNGRNLTSQDNQLMNVQTIEDIVAMFKNHFALMQEYMKACQLIPQLDKAIDTIVRDTINADEVTYTFLNNFYQDNDDKKATKIEEKIKELLNEYDLETKLWKWIKDAEVMGAKPVTVLPLDDVLVGVNRAIKEGVTHKTSTESQYIQESDMLIPNPINIGTIRQYKRIQDIKQGLTTSTEDMEFAKKTQESIERKVEGFTEGIISPDLVDEYCRICNEDWADMVKMEKKKVANDRTKYDNLVRSVEDFEKKIANADADERYNAISKEMQELILYVNSFIEVVDEKKAAKYQSLRYLRKKKFSNEQEDEEGYKDNIIHDFYGVKGRDTSAFNPMDETSHKMKDGDIDKAKIQGVDVDMSEKPVDIKEFKRHFKNKRAILTDHDPEYVIPVTNDAGEHIGYFILEYVRMNDENYSIVRKNRGSFLDILRKLGIGEDKALVAGTSTMAHDNMAPYSSGLYSPTTILSPMTVNNVNGPLTSFGSGFNSRRLKQKNDLVKTIFVKTITKRLKKNLGDDLEKNGTFQSSLMNIIRDEMLFKNNVRFTFIPEDHMVYFNRTLDSQGYPLSVLDGTLFYIYVYLNSIMSSIMAKVMKSSNSEVMEINVGIAKNINATVEQIQQHASTRNVSSRTMFGGTDSIIRTVGAYKRMIVPVINGEKLYDISSLEAVNDVEIDDEFTDEILKSIIMKIGLPPTLMDMMSQDEYVASMTQHRIDYRNLIVQRGIRYGMYVTKLIRLIVNYSDMTVPKEDNVVQSAATPENPDKSFVDMIQLEKINFKFSPPRAITINKLKDEVDQISPLVDEIVKIQFGDQDPEGNEWPVVKNEIRRSLIRYFASSTDWSEIDDLIDEARLNGVRRFNEMAKYSIPTTTGDEGDQKTEADEELEADNADMDKQMEEGDFGGAPE